MFNVPDQVPWTVFSQALSNYFEQQTGRGLNEQNLEYLARKLQNGQFCKLCRVYIRNFVLLTVAAVPNSEMDLSNFAITYSMIVKVGMGNRDIIVFNISILGSHTSKQERRTECHILGMVLCHL